jgi:hypothetical protein
MGSEAPLGHLVEHALVGLVECIEYGEFGITWRQVYLRACLVRIVHSLPILCTRLLAEARQHEGFEPILFYERVRLGIVSPYYFMDGVPASISLFEGPTTVSLPSGDVCKLKLCDVLADRLRTVKALECLQRGCARKIQLCEGHSAGTSENVPGPVRFLLARTRALLQCLAANKRASQFKFCDNMNCRRRCYIGGPAESWASGAASAVGDVDEERDSTEYWSAASGVTIKDVPDTRRFCSNACAREHSDHLECMMPVALLDMDADDSAKKIGRARVQEAFKMVLKRNEIAARALRTLRSKGRSNLAVSTQELEEHRRRFITMLNVDLGVLHAASVISESKCLSSGKVLPGQVMYWRDQPFYYAKVLKAVIQMYERVGKRDDIVSTTLTTPRFLQHIQNNAYKMF